MMVDSFNKVATDASSPDGVSSGATGSSGFLSTTMGKIVLGGVALIVIGAAIVAILLVFVFNQDDVINVPVIIPTETTATTSAAGESEPTERRPDEWVDTFAFRNIFEPTSKVTLSPEVSADGGSGATSETVDTDIPEDTLYLSSITTVDGVLVANLVWNGATYPLSEGGTIPGTPWKVLSVSGDTVVMLYGDTRITLGVGQGISSK